MHLLYNCRVINMMEFREFSESYEIQHFSSHDKAYIWILRKMNLAQMLQFKCGIDSYTFFLKAEGPLVNSSFVNKISKFDKICWNFCQFCKFQMQNLKIFNKNKGERSAPKNFWIYTLYFPKVVRRGGDIFVGGGGD